MRRLSPLLAVLLALGLTVGACSRKDTSAKDLKEQVSTALRKGDDGLTRDQADCYADLLIDEVGADDVNDIGLTDKEPDAAVAKKVAAAATKARSECKIDVP
jgi:hypothetical protein